MNQESTPAAIDFYFDFSCPYAYLGSTQLARIEAETGRPVRYKPFLLGGVFRALDQAQNMSTTLSEPKKRHNRADLIRWASWFDVPLRTPMRHPNRTVEALRALLACPQARWREVIEALYRVYWVDGGDISDAAVLRDSLRRLELDAEAVLSRADSAEIKQELFARTDEAIGVGVFGAPAFVVDGQLFWGQDRIEMVVRAAAGWRAPTGPDGFALNQDTN